MKIKQFFATSFLLLTQGGRRAQSSDLPQNCDILQKKLSNSDLSYFGDVLEKTVSLTPISLDQLMSNFEAIEDDVNKQSSPYFWSFLCFTEYLELPCKVTYDDTKSCAKPDYLEADPANHDLPPDLCPKRPEHLSVAYLPRYGYGVYEGTGTMTMGIGLNIAYEDRKAVVYKTNATWNFDELQAEVEKPDYPMTSTEIINMFYYTLMGATAAGQTYKGQLEILRDSLGSSLASQPFRVNELVALLSLSFNGPSLLGNGTRTALENYLKTGDDLDVVREIVQYCNGEGALFRVGIEDRRLNEAAFFHGNLTDIYLPWLEYGKICGEVDVAENNHPPKYLTTKALPEGSVESQYTGKEAVVIEDGYDPAYLDKTAYGTASDDSLVLSNRGANADDPGHLSLLGGAGDDVLSVEDLDAYSHYHALTGHEGYDTYILKPGESAFQHVLITDSDGRGVVRAMLPGKNITLQGVFWVDGQGHYQLTVNQSVYPLYLGEDAENQAILEIAGERFSVVIQGMPDGSLGIMSADVPQVISSQQAGVVSMAGYLPSHQLAVVNQDSKNKFISLSTLPLDANTSEGSITLEPDIDASSIEAQALTSVFYPNSNDVDLCVAHRQTLNYGQKLVVNAYPVQNGILSATGSRYYIYTSDRVCQNSKQGPSCQYGNVVMTSLNNERQSLIVAYTRWTSASPTKTVLQFYDMHTNVLEGFTVNTWSGKGQPADFRVAPYDDEHFVLAILDSNDGQITCYIYHPDRILMDTINIQPEVPIQEMVALTALQSSEKPGFMITYTDNQNQTHSQVIYSSQLMSPSSILSESIGAKTASVCVNDDTCFIADDKRGTFIDHDNQPIGDVFSMSTSTADCELKQPLAAASSPERATLLITASKNTSNVCLFSIKTSRLLPGNPSSANQHLHWSQRHGSAFFSSQQRVMRNDPYKVHGARQLSCC